MSKYQFKPLKSGYEVSYKRRRLGTIHPAKEATGRHCFYLGIDTRREPRTYRGKVRAAEALRTINWLLRLHKARKWPPAYLIVRAWDERPRASDQW
jgi:hypothetical protein